MCGGSGAHEIRKYKEIPHEVLPQSPDSPPGDAKTRRGMLSSLSTLIESYFQ